MEAVPLIPTPHNRRNTEISSKLLRPQSLHCCFSGFRRGELEGCCCNMSVEGLSSNRITGSGKNLSCSSGLELVFEPTAALRALNSFPTIAANLKVTYTPIAGIPQTRSTGIANRTF